MQYLLDGNIPHAAEMAKRAFALEAGAALEVQPEHPRRARLRRRVLGAGGAEERDLRPAERGGDVHEAGVVADHHLRAGMGQYAAPETLPEQGILSLSFERLSETIEVPVASWRRRASEAPTRNRLVPPITIAGGRAALVSAASP